MGTSTNIPELPDRQRTFHGRLLDAAGVREASLSPSARRTLAWLAAWDEPTIAGLEDLLHAARGRVDRPHRERLVCVAGDPQERRPVDTGPE